MSNPKPMKPFAALLVLLCALSNLAAAQSPPDASSSERDQDSMPELQLRHHWHGHHQWRGDAEQNQYFSIGHDTHLPAGARADSVVAVLGSAVSEGNAENVLSVLGNTRATGPVEDSAVSVVGNTYIDSTIGGDAVAVLGDVELGPHAEIGGDVVAIGGQIKRDPAAVIHGQTQGIFLGDVGFDWLRPWIRHCLLLGRPLAVAPGLGWAWYLALSFLVFYALLALVFQVGVQRCVSTFDANPGPSAVAALLAVLLSPILFVLLCITVIGIAAIPLLLIGTFCAGLFGKVVMLAWIGQRCVGRRGADAMIHPALAVLLGGAVVLLLYVVPVIGFIVYKLLGLLGLGAVLLTVIQAVHARQAGKPVPPGLRAAGESTLAGGTAAMATAADAQGPAGTQSSARTQGSAQTQGSADAQVSTAATPPTATFVTATLPRAGFWVRIAALVLDALLVGILIGLLHHVFDMELLLLATYGAVMWKLRGSTIGGIVFDLQVVRQDGREIDWGTAIVRALGCFLSLAAAGLGFIWIAFDPGKQAWHDKIAGTIVVRTPKGLSLV